MTATPEHHDSRAGTEPEVVDHSSAEFIVGRNAGSSMSGCLGQVSYTAADGSVSGGWYGIPAEYILGRHFGDGARVRVTVELLDAGGPVDRCMRAHRDTTHADHNPGPDLIAGDGTRWTWSEPDGVGGSRQLIHTYHAHHPRAGTTYLEGSYSAGYRQLGEPVEVHPTRRDIIERERGGVTEAPAGSLVVDGGEPS